MARGIALIVVAVVLGIVLLRSTDKSPTFTEGASTGGKPTVTTVTTEKGAPTTTSTTVAVAKAHNPAEVTILVANGSGKPGVAAKIASLLKGSNFVLKESTNTKTPATATRRATSSTPRPWPRCSRPSRAPPRCRPPCR